MTNLSPVQKAREVLEKWGLHEAPIQIEKIYSGENIELEYIDLTEIEQKVGKKISGAIQQRPGKSCIILVNDMDSEARARFTIAHELGHYFLHMDSMPPNDSGLITCLRSDSSPIETQANRFAAELLMPEALVRQEYAKMVIPVCESLAEIFQVSNQAMEIRLKQLELGYV